MKLVFTFENGVGYAFLGTSVGFKSKISDIRSSNELGSLEKGISKLASRCLAPVKHCLVQCTDE